MFSILVAESVNLKLDSFCVVFFQILLGDALFHQREHRRAIVSSRKFHSLCFSFAVKEMLLSSRKFSCVSNLELCGVSKIIFVDFYLLILLL